MLKEIRDCLQSFCEISKNMENSKVATRLKNIELKLGSIEEEMRLQSRFALFAFAYGLALAAISIGFAIIGDNPSGALLLMLAGSGLLLVLAILGVTLGFSRIFKSNKQKD